MKITEHGVNYKRNLIHLFVAGALALSWGTVNHVNDFLHSHLLRGKNTRPATKPAYKADKSKSQEGVILTQAGPPVSKEGTILAQISEALVGNVVIPKAAAQPEAVQAQVKKKSILEESIKNIFKPNAVAAQPTESLVSKLAAKAGINIASITDTKIDRGFIRRVEGSVLKGYVPLASSTNSGVTIADGFDLGQMRLTEFNKLPISDDLKAKLKPYIGLTRFKAVSFLKAHPLIINEHELNQLNIVAANKILHPLMKTYQKSTGESFLSLPPQAQTAIFSFAYQWGPGFMFQSAHKQLWHFFMTKNWQKASTTLKNYKMYSARRHMEASLLDHIS